MAAAASTSRASGGGPPSARGRTGRACAAPEAALRAAPEALRAESRERFRARKGFPPDVSTRRRRSGRGKAVPSRSWRSRWSAPRASGPRGIEAKRSRGNARSRSRNASRRGPLRNEESNALIRETPGREAEDAFARCVEPLEIVDGDEDRARVRARAMRQGMQRPRPGAPARGPRPRRPTARPRAPDAAEEAAAHVRPPETDREISDAGERKLCLGLSGTGDEEPKRAFTASPTPASQRVVLPIPASPVRTIPAGPCPSATDERREDRLYLLLPSDDGCAHRGYSS